MRDENRDLLEPFFVPKYNLKAIWDTAWEERFQPCSFPVVQPLVGELEKKGATFEGSTLSILLRLVDASQVVLDMNADEKLIRVYPRCVLEVAQLYVEDPREQAKAVTVTEKVVEGLMGAKWEISPV